MQGIQIRLASIDNLPKTYSVVIFGVFNVKKIGTQSKVFNIAHLWISCNMNQLETS